MIMHYIPSISRLLFILSEFERLGKYPCPEAGEIELNHGPSLAMMKKYTVSLSFGPGLGGWRLFLHDQGSRACF